MKNPDFILKEEKQNKALDFFFLKNEGIRFIQELTGAFWTDYNEHDPGITILEQICYALTDLAYRTDFEIQDHLTGNSEKAFYTPDEIFPCNALTIDDYRKIFFDSIPEIKNIWLIPTEPNENSLLGLYKILVEFEETSEEKKAELIAKVHHIYSKHRNLCEDLEEIIVLEPLPISIFADIEVERMDEIEHILAEIFFQISEFFSPEVHFYSLREMIEQGFEVQHIFDGPLLKHGFIHTTSLQPKMDKIAISEIIKIMMQVRGVVSVKNLYLKAGLEIVDNQVEVKKHQIPKLIFGSSVGKEDFTINFYKGSISHQTIDSFIFKRRLNELQSANKRVYRLSDESLEIPQGKKIDIQEYYSIQHHFPEIYGIGDAGIPNVPDTKRKAQAKQLKGYLMLFEQIMANYLAQLAHLKDLFSSRSDIENTYFYQSIAHLPQAKELLTNQPEKWVEDALLSQHKIPLSYEEGLARLMQIKDDFIDRRNRFLDFLLATNGDTYLQYSISQKNFYFGKVEFERDLIKNKSLLLQYLPQINLNRAKAFDYFQDLFGQENLSGLEMRINILLGLGTHQPSKDEKKLFVKKALFDVFDSRNLKIIQEDSESPELQIWMEMGNLENRHITKEKIESDFDYIDEADFEDLNISELEKRFLLSYTLIFRTNLITNQFLKFGLDLKNFRIGQLDTGKYVLLFHNPDKEIWTWISESDNEKHILATAQLVYNFVRELNLESEGFHLVEHILFRPDIDDKKFGFYLLDEEGNNFFRTTERYTFEERISKIAHIQDVSKHLAVYENYGVERRNDGDFEIHFKLSDDSDSMHFVSMKAYESVQEIHEKMDRVFVFLADKEYQTPFQEKIAMYIQNTAEDRTIPEDFFSYKVSVVLPNWSARFNNSEFRLVVEEVIQADTPANVAVDVLWLNIQEMRRFESLYYDWAKEKQKNGHQQKERLDRLSNHFTQLLLQLSEKN